MGTLAAWTDSATVTSGSFATGTLDLRVGEASADQLGGQGGSWQHASLTLSDLAPGRASPRCSRLGTPARSLSPGRGRCRPPPMPSPGRTDSGSPWCATRPG
ncbi:SipW-dependent-type signal peptide-containing protein [Nocardioides alcanivorans]|uniref:SipW-dependent-type signal peptide-containing protein n=1 Tax=Nocardioides alcanivorans TaxID=2897352 RepID=UPI0035E062CD